MSEVLVLNADGDLDNPLTLVTVKHAIRMLLRKVAVIAAAEPDRQIGVFPMPKAVQLVNYIFPKWRHSRGPAWSRSGVLKRDGYACGYCGGHATTVDHIHPQSKGGGNEWLNTVAACARCNQRKGCRTLAEAKMRLRFQPTIPTWSVLSAR